MRYVIAVLACGAEVIAYAMFGAMLGWDSGGGIIPMMLLFGLVGWTWRAVTKTRSPEDDMPAAGLNQNASQEENSETGSIGAESSEDLEDKPVLPEVDVSSSEEQEDSHASNSSDRALGILLLVAMVGGVACLVAYYMLEQQPSDRTAYQTTDPSGVSSRAKYYDQDKRAKNYSTEQGAVGNKNLAKPYKNAKYDFKISFPKGWIVKGSQVEGTIVKAVRKSPDGKLAMISVAAFHLGKDIDMWAMTGKEAFEAFNGSNPKVDAALLDWDKTLIAGEHAQWRRVDIRKPAFNSSVCKNFNFVHDGTLFRISLGTSTGVGWDEDEQHAWFKKNKSLMEASVKSFDLIKASEG